MTKWTTGLAAGLLILCSCAGPGGNRPVMRLPSGDQVRVIKTGPIFGAGAKGIGVMFQYETDLKISDTTALRREAGEVFSMIQPDAERAHETSVIVSALEKPTGFIVKSSHGYNFVFQRQSDGSWRCLGD